MLTSNRYTKSIYDVSRICSSDKDIRLIFRFLGVFLLLYYINILCIAVTDNKGVLYSSFIRDNLDYLNWIRYGTLSFSQNLSKSFSLDVNYVYPFKLVLANNEGFIVMNHSCIGYGIFSFWLAFVVANPISVKKKVIWGGCGVFILWLANCCRMVLLVEALHSRTFYKYYNHHTLFNIATYILIFGMVYLFTKSNKQVEPTNDAGAAL